MKRTIFLSTVLILGLSLVTGCKGTPSAGGIIFGKVTEAGTGIPLEGVTVTVLAEGSKFTVTTDSSGNYSIANIPPGSYEVSTFFQGYHLNVVKDVQGERGKKKKVDFELVIMGGGT